MKKLLSKPIASGTVSFILFTMLLVLAAPADAKEKSWNVWFGLSWFSESNDSETEAGSGWSIALGRDLTKYIGIECELEYGPSSTDFNYVQHLDSTIFEQMQSSDVDHAGVFNFSLMGTLTRPLTNTFNWVLKIGVTNFTNDAEVTVYTKDGDRLTEWITHSKGRIAVVSAGLEFAPFQDWDSGPISLSLKRYVGEQHNWLAMSLGASIRF